MSTNWHDFAETADEDNECTDCGVVVTNEALPSFTAPCPAPPCSSDVNLDERCVVVPGRGEVCRCIYCGRTGGRIPTDELDDPALDDELEVAGV